MSQVLPEQGRKPFFDGFSVGQLVATVLAALVVSIGAASLSVWVSQATTLQRLTVVEEEQKKSVTRELLDERWKTVERIDRNVERLRELFIPQKRDDAR
jgi:hypothetical protein